jgi:hypothetical protein
VKCTYTRDAHPAVWSIFLRRFSVALICLLHHTAYVSKCECAQNVAVKSSSPVETAGTTLTSAGTSRRFRASLPPPTLRIPVSFGLSHRQPITLHLRPHESCGVKAAIGMLSQYSSNNQGTCLMNDDELPERIYLLLFAGIFNSVVSFGFGQPLFNPRRPPTNSPPRATLLAQPIPSANCILKVSSACFADQGWISCSTLPMHFRA